MYINWKQEEAEKPLSILWASDRALIITAYPLFYSQKAVRIEVMEGKTDKDRVMQAVKDSADELGYEIYEASVLFKGVNSKLVVKIDVIRGISHGDCEAFSKNLSARLDDLELLPNYSLEVSSPGLDRKIRSIEEYKRFTGSPVKIVFQNGEIRRAIKGKLAGIQDNVVVIESDEGHFEIACDDIRAANLSF